MPAAAARTSRDGDARALENHLEQIARAVERDGGLAVHIEQRALLGQDLAFAGRHGDADVAMSEVEAGHETVGFAQGQQGRGAAAARTGAAAPGGGLADQPLAQELRDERGGGASGKADGARELRAADRTLVSDHRDQVASQQPVGGARTTWGIGFSNDLVGPLEGLAHERRVTDLPSLLAR